MRSAQPCPTTRITSPSPTSNEVESQDGASASLDEGKAERETAEQEQSDSDPAFAHRARTRSHGSIRSCASASARRRRTSSTTSTTKSPPPLSSDDVLPSNGYLSPLRTTKARSGSWRDVSRSPSPLGLIPLHSRYRNLIHRHEIPRKLLHVSIGVFTLQFYRTGIQTSQVTPWLLSALVPIAAIDVVRHRFETVNRLYIRTVGGLMRETEVNGYNGVIWYLLGAYVVLRFFPKDVGVMGVLLLSWCDTAASTFGRLYGRYTPRLRKGKSLAGSAAAWVVGAATAAAFWGWLVPRVGGFPNDPPDALMFKGRLHLLPGYIGRLIGWSADAGASRGVVSGPCAVGIMSLVSGVVAAGSELVDLFGWDDNFTIPVLSGIGLWGFLKVFG